MEKRHLKSFPYLYQLRTNFEYIHSLKKIFRRISGKKFDERFPENAHGDFYVQNQVCIACGAPEAEAPDLIDHSKIEYGHCYFKKQPKTPDELSRAISAMQVSCISGLRYGGKDEEILKHLYESGLADECAHQPAVKIKLNRQKA